MAFIDFRKAYDTVWRDGLLYKLGSTGISGKCYRLIENMYKSCTSCVKVAGGVTEYFEMNVGV